MTVATFAITDNTTQTGVQYKANIDADSMVMKRVVDCFAPRQTTVPAMTITLDAGFVFSGTTLTEIAAQTSSAITAPVGNPRIDRAVIDKATGALSIVTGTPNASPVAPAIPSGKVPVAQILLQTSSTTITNSMITDERVLWAVGRGLVGEMSIGQWLKDNGSGALTLNINATLQDDGAGALSTGLTTEATIASAATCNLGSAASNIIQITGTTTITSFGSSANAADPLYIVRFAAAATVTHNANIILQAAVNFVATAGSFMVLKYEGSGVWREIFHEKNSMVTAGSYTSVNVTVDKTGRITAISSGTASSGVVKRQVFPSSGTYTPDTYMVTADVELVGGGAPGTSNAGSGNPKGAGAGGSAGGYSRKLVTRATVGTSQAVTVASANGTTTFGSIFSATGAATGTNASGATSGVPGAPGVGVGGDINIRGSYGHMGSIEANQSSPAAPLGGNGGDSYFGGAGLDTISAQANTGSGGGANGGAGGTGYCIVTEYCSQ